MSIGRGEDGMERINSALHDIRNITVSGIDYNDRQTEADGNIEGGKNEMDLMKQPKNKDRLNNIESDSSERALTHNNHSNGGSSEPYDLWDDSNMDLSNDDGNVRIEMKKEMDGAAVKIVDDNGSQSVRSQQNDFRNSSLIPSSFDELNGDVVKEESGETSPRKDELDQAYANGFDAEFQRLIHSISDEVVFKEQNIFRDLSRLSKDFVAAATRYGHLIICEKYLPIEQKTCKPVSWLRGIAGGEKYYAAGIVFRFAVDNHQLYGSDELAGKEANHQLRTLTQIYNANIDDLCFPLLAVIEYRGFKLVASSLLPIDGTTLVYGSQDAGLTIEDGEKYQRAREIAAQVASKLNLKLHRVMCRNSEAETNQQMGFNSIPMQGDDPKKIKELYLPVDVEIHKSRIITSEDDPKAKERLYIIDYGRFFPPEPPGVYKQLINFNKIIPTATVSLTNTDNGTLTSSTTDSSASASQSTDPSIDSVNFMDEDEIHNVLKCPSPHLTRLLRPEFVKSNPVPLSSDAYSQFGLLDKHKHNTEVDESYRRLIYKVIPACASALDKVSQKTFRQQKLTGDFITKHLHQHGVNMRYLGLVYEHTNAPFWKAQLLHEAVARSCKAYVRSALRRTARKVRIASSTPFLSTTADALNTLFGKAPCFFVNASQSCCSSLFSKYNRCSSCKASCPCHCKCTTNSVAGDGGLDTSTSEPEIFNKIKRTGSVASMESSNSSFDGSSSGFSLSPRSRDDNPLFFGTNGSSTREPRLSFSKDTDIYSLSPSMNGQSMMNISMMDASQLRLFSLKKRWWCKLLPILLIGRFSFSEHSILTILQKQISSRPREELSNSCTCCGCAWRKQIDPTVVFLRIQSTCGIILSPSAAAEVESSLFPSSSSSAAASASSSALNQHNILSQITSSFSQVDISNTITPEKPPASNKPSIGMTRNTSNTSLPSLASASGMKRQSSATENNEPKVYEPLFSQNTLIFSYEEPFDENDILDVVGSVSVLPLIDYAEGTCLSIRAKQKKAHGFFAEAKRLAVAAQNTFENGLRKSPNDALLLCNIGFLDEDVFGKIDKAAEKYVAAIRASNGIHARSWYYLGLFIRRHGEGTTNHVLEEIVMNGLQPIVKRDIQLIRDQMEMPAASLSHSSSSSSQTISGSNANAPSISIVQREKRRSLVNALCELCFQKSLESGGKPANSLKELGNFMRYSKNDPVKAEYYYKKALELDPTQLRALENLASLYEQQKRFILALPLWISAVAIAPDDLLLHIQLEICRYSVLSLEMEATDANLKSELQHDNDTEDAKELDTIDGSASISTGLTLAQKQDVAFANLKHFLQAVDAMVKRATEGNDESSNRSVHMFQNQIYMTPHKKKHHKGMVLWLGSDGTGDLYMVHRFCRALLRVIETAFLYYPKVCETDQTCDLIHLFYTICINVGKAALDSYTSASSLFPETPAAKQTAHGFKRLYNVIMKHYAIHLCDCAKKPDLAEAEGLLVQCVAMDRSVINQKALEDFRKRFNIVPLQPTAASSSSIHHPPGSKDGGNVSPKNADALRS